MALTTWLDITASDAQGRTGVVSFRIKPAALGSTTLPTVAKIAAVIDALFGLSKLSTGIVQSYAVRVVEDAPTSAGGDGAVSMSTAIRARSNKGAIPFLNSLPGANQSYLTFDTDDRNSISTLGGLWPPLRAALVDSEIAISAPTGAYAALAEGLIFQTASMYDGKRSPFRAG